MLPSLYNTGTPVPTKAAKLGQLKEMGSYHCVTFFMLPGLQNTTFLSVLEGTAVSCSDLNSFLVMTLSLCNVSLNPLVTGTQSFPPVCASSS